MRKIKKRIVSFITAILVLCIVLSPTAFAKSDYLVLSETCIEQLTDQLDLLSMDTGNFRIIAESDIVELYIGEAIVAYEYVNTELKKASFVIYPVFYNDDLVYTATYIQDATEQIQLSECFVDVFSTYCGLPDGVAIIYDSQKCYLATPGNISELWTLSHEVSHRSLLQESSFEQLSKQKIVYTRIEGLQKIDYDQNVKLRSSASLSVPFVTQNPPSNICWAASVACIGNYLTSSYYSYTALNIAQSVYGINWNQPADISVALSTLYNNYSIYYGYNGYGAAPSDSIVYSNLYAGYPVYSVWSWTDAGGSGNHAAVIKAISTGLYVSVMDPEYGTCIAYKSSGIYSYVSPYSGNVLTLCGYGAYLPH